MIMGKTYNGFENMFFDNRFTKNLPGDPDTVNTRRQVENACYSLVKPTPAPDPRLVAFSHEAASLIDLKKETCFSDLFTEVFTGNHLLPGMMPFAMCYGGHQFGYWAGQLGDGRAINLGELVNLRGERWMLQLKGAGPTPYSRTADGLAVLRSSIREFLCSEAMFHLGVPTTRALSLTLTGAQVKRDMFYDGNPKLEPGAVVCRLAPSFTRFGNFQILAARGENDLLKQLIDYTIATDFPHLDPLSPKVYEKWFNEICLRTMDMIIHWMRVGFVHGVMNTDNMSILGLTIDYGPYGWLEDYDPNWTPNTTDAQGRRYCFGNQPEIALWNLAQLANAVFPVVKNSEPLQTALDEAAKYVTTGQFDMMAQKLGFESFKPDTDISIIEELLMIFQLEQIDYTLFFRGLSDLDTKETLNNEDDLAKYVIPSCLKPSFYHLDGVAGDHARRLEKWIEIYKNRLKGVSDEKRKSKMNMVNPKYVFRNYLAQTAIDKAESGDFSLVWELLDVMRNPYDEQPGREKFAEKRPEWALNRPGCSMLSCSS